MFGVSDYGAYVAAVLVFLFIPGPGNLAILSSTAKGGVRGGLSSTGGIIVGDQVLIWLAVAGVATILLTTPALFVTIQWLGAAYLAWLGLKMVLAKPGAGAVVDIPVGAYFRQSFFITLLNPKSIVFYMAFFPLFLDPAVPPSLVTFAAMALTAAALAALYGLGLSLLAQHLAERVKARPWLSQALQKTAGGLLIAFGLRLVLTK
ncbi:MAG: lysine transporter LysE [Betaproteobacteria bacterium]|nr:lysine transporter LysE [Betaproteobacteria bacterium]NBY06258.1 lysine transporter LysE [Betaproteobacteria bacterium]